MVQPKQCSAAGGRLHCYNGGECVAEKGHDPRCLCPVGFTGTTCQKGEPRMNAVFIASISNL